MRNTLSAQRMHHSHLTIRTARSTHLPVYLRRRGHATILRPPPLLPRDAVLQSRHANNLRLFAREFRLTIKTMAARPLIHCNRKRGTPSHQSRLRFRARPFLPIRASFGIFAAEPPRVRHIKRAGIIGHTGNVAHDLYLNGGMLDLFATGDMDVLLLDAADNFAELIKSRNDSWQLTVLSALFNSSGDSAGVVPLWPLRGKQIVCIEELYWKPPALDFNPFSSTLAHVPSARARILRALNLVDHAFSGRGRNRQKNAILYTRGDAGRRALTFKKSMEGGTRGVRRRWFRGGKETIEFANTSTSLQILHKLPPTPYEQLALFASADIVLAAHGAASANALVMKPGSAYIEVSPLCQQLCSCYPYSYGGTTCAPRSLIDTTHAFSAHQKAGEGAAVGGGRGERVRGVYEHPCRLDLCSRAQGGDRL